MIEKLTDDLEVLSVFLLAIVATIVIGVALHRLAKWKAESSRRWIHSSSGILVVASTYFFESPVALYLVAFAFLVVNYYLNRNRLIGAMHGIERKSLGTVTFPLALLFALYFCWTLDPVRIHLLQLSFLIMAIADPLASLVGSGFDGESNKELLPSKSLFGTLTFFFSTAALLHAFPKYFLGFDYGLLVIFLVASLLTAIELLSKRGWDNFFIVVAAVASLTAINQILLSDKSLLIMFAAAGGLALGSYFLKFLDTRGALAVFVLGLSLLLIGAWVWVLAPLVFFVSSSLLSKAPARYTKRISDLHEKGSVRDDGQVWANGGVGLACALLYLFFPNSVFLIGFIASFAAAAADTWATEIGMRFGQNPRSIVSFKPLEKGQSGGVTLQGFLGAFAGSALISLSILAAPTGNSIWTSFTIITIVGFGASVIDSFLGASIQAEFIDFAGRSTERRESGGRQNNLLKGVVFINNDMVNLISVAIATLTAVLIHLAP